MYHHKNPIANSDDPAANPCSGSIPLPNNSNTSTWSGRQDKMVVHHRHWRRPYCIRAYGRHNTIASNSLILRASITIYLGIMIIQGSLMGIQGRPRRLQGLGSVTRPPRVTDTAGDVGDASTIAIPTEPPTRAPHVSGTSEALDRPTAPTPSKLFL